MAAEAPRARRAYVELGSLAAGAGAPREAAPLCTASGRAIAVAAMDTDRARVAYRAFVRARGARFNLGARGEKRPCKLVRHDT
jgi:hypothetical protein